MYAEFLVNFMSRVNAREKNPAIKPAMPCPQPVVVREVMTFGELFGIEF